MTERDPNGLGQHVSGAKLDSGKVMADLLLLFSRALIQVAEVGTFGANKYTYGGWQDVSDGERRYRGARLRHELYRAHQGEVDPDSGLFHLAHLTWNSLAELELMLRRLETEDASVS